MTDDLAPFESPNLLIYGAKASIVDFKTMCDSFIEKCTYDTIEYTEPKTGEKIVKCRFHHRVPPAMRIPASRIVNDLRHSLDQAACDGAVMLGRPNAKGVYFPFGKTPKNLEDEIKTKLANVHPDLVAFIKQFKAHYGGDDLLYALSALAGPNKHQRILRISMGDGGFMIDGTKPWAFNSGTGTVLGVNIWNELRNELILHRYGKGSSGHIETTPILQIVLGTGEPPLKSPAATVLSDMASKVESIVMGIEAETARIIGP